MLLSALTLAACASTDSRIRDHQAAFDHYPPAIQQKIRAGQIDLGFTPEMVEMALGKPDHRYQRTTAQGSSDVWGYSDDSPQFSFGLGGGSFGGSTGLGGGVGISTGQTANQDKLRVVFSSGRVSAIERTTQP